MTRTAQALRWSIHAYQRMREGRPSPCRYLPSCSSYAMEAIDVHGARRGSWLAVRRVCRCHPWGGQGWDPVPLPASEPDSAPDHLCDRTAS